MLGSIPDLHQPDARSSLWVRNGCRPYQHTEDAGPLQPPPAVSPEGTRDGDTPVGRPAATAAASNGAPFGLGKNRILAPDC